MKRVVTTFVRNEHHQLLLLQRAPLMRAYPNTWSAVSGSIEPENSPEQQAIQELQEETSLSAEHVFSGEPLLLRDPTHGLFQIYPLLHSTKDLNPSLNEENCAFRWTDRLPESDTVPALGEVLRRAKGGSRRWLSSTLREALLRWKNDLENGAVELSLQAARLLASAAQEYPAETSEARVCMIRGLALKMVEAHPDMPIIERVLGNVLRGLRTNGVEGAQDAAREREEKLQSARERAAQLAADLLYRSAQREEQPTWLTLSASSTVHRTFEILSARLAQQLPSPPHLRILESRPLGEGVLLAKKLHAEGCSVSLYPDAAMMNALRGCHGVLLGADAIFVDGSARNKIGSAMLARLAHDEGIPVYVIADTWKITPRSGTEPNRSKLLSGGDAIPEGGELSQSVPLFEIIRGSLVTNIITEEGALDARLLEKLSERRAMWSRQPSLVWGDNLEEP